MRGGFLRQTATYTQNLEPYYMIYGYRDVYAHAGNKSKYD
jgi:hypothetical protein